MPNGRCHLHGGLSTGAKTKEGKLRRKMAHWKDGLRSKESLAEAKQLRDFMKECKEAIQG